jgi:hypothetical protein
MLTLPLPGDVVRCIADMVGSIDMLIAAVLALGFVLAALGALTEALLGLARTRGGELSGAQDSEELDSEETEDKSVQRAIRGSREYRRREMMEGERERQQQRDREDDNRREFEQRMLDHWQ